MDTPIKPYSYIAIFYQDGDNEALQRSQSLKRRLHAAPYAMPIELIAYRDLDDLAATPNLVIIDRHNPLLIAAGDDAAYHRLIDAMLEHSPNRRAHLVCAQLSTYEAIGPLVEAIRTEHVILQDLIQLNLAGPEQSEARRYALSSCAIGLDATASAKLTKPTPHPMKELSLVVSHFKSHRPFSMLDAGNHTKSMDALIIANLSQMTKSEKRQQPGQLSVIELPHRDELRTGMTALRALTIGLKELYVPKYRFKILEDRTLYLDCEAFMLKVATRVELTILPDAIKTLVMSRP